MPRRVAASVRLLAACSYKVAPAGMERVFTRLAMMAAGALTVLAVTGCTLKHPTANLVHGKLLFVQKCGSCHTLSHAGSTGTVGPNLDDAFAQPRADGEKSSSIQGLVSYWIQYPNVQGVMPAKLYTGQAAQDVAAYVAHVAAIPGADTGELASAVQQQVPVTPAEGKKVFTGIGGCGSCHALADAGTTGQTGPNLSTRLPADCTNADSQRIRGKTIEECLTTAIVKPYAYLPAGYRPGIMPNNFGKQLSTTQIRALVAYLASVTK
jgi:mono/diheme cytochrome c family protein